MMKKHVVYIEIAPGCLERTKQSSPHLMMHVTPTAGSLDGWVSIPYKILYAAERILEVGGPYGTRWLKNRLDSPEAPVPAGDDWIYWLLGHNWQPLKTVGMYGNV